MRKERPIVEEKYDLKNAGYFDVPDDEKDEESEEWGILALAYYNAGEYGKALQYLTWLLKKRPNLKPYIFYYIRVCKRVVSVSLTKAESKYEAKLARKRALPKWLKWMVVLGEVLARCKWCGHYTRWVDPNKPTFGFATSANCCASCNRMYPMPCWIWDSPDGRAYSYFRGSFGADEKFYQEFERDYDPRPPRQLATLRSIKQSSIKIAKEKRHIRTVTPKEAADELWAMISKNINDGDDFKKSGIKFFDNFDEIHVQEIEIMYLWAVVKTIPDAFEGIIVELKQNYLNNFQTTENDRINDLIIDRFSKYEELWNNDNESEQTVLSTKIMFNIYHDYKSEKEEDYFLLGVALDWIEKKLFSVMQLSLIYMNKTGITQNESK